MFNQYKIPIIGLFVFILGVALGGVGTYYLFPRTITNTVEKPVIQETVKYIDRTEVVYVPKTSPTDADVEITKAQPAVKVAVNGKDYEFKLEQKEEQKFDQGKLVVNQSGAISVDVKTHVEKRNWTLKVGQSNNGIAGGLDYQMGNILIWTYVDPKTYGAGVGVKF